MTTQTLSILFEDSISDSTNPAVVAASAENLARQILSAAEKIKADGKAVNHYIRITTPCPSFAPTEAMKPTETVTIAPTVEAPKIPKVLTVDETIPLLEKVFADLKRTEKSVKIVSVFAANSGIDLSIDRLVRDTGLNKNDLSSWLAQTGKRIKAITNPSRGVYKFDPDKL